MSYMNQIDFTASVKDIFDGAGNAVSPELGRGVYRDDTSELLSVCGPQYVPVQHCDLVKPILLDLERAGYKIDERPAGAGRGPLYDLKGKQGAFISTNVQENGAVMRTDIILGDFIDVTSSTGDYGLAKGEDTNLFRISLLNSHNGRYAVRANTSYERIICLNGMTSPSFKAEAVRGRHTKGFSLDAMQAQLGNAFAAIDADADKFQLWAGTALDVKAAEKMLQLTLAKLPNAANGDAKYSEQLVAKVLDLFRFEPKTVWGLFNAITAWQTHEQLRAGSKEISSMVAREERVASTLRSNPWADLVK